MVSLREGRTLRVEPEEAVLLATPREGGATGGLTGAADEALRDVLTGAASRTDAPFDADAEGLAECTGAASRTGAFFDADTEVFVECTGAASRTDALFDADTEVFAECTGAASRTGALFDADTEGLAECTGAASRTDALFDADTEVFVECTGAASRTGALFDADTETFGECTGVASRTGALFDANAEAFSTLSGASSRTGARFDADEEAFAALTGAATRTGALFDAGSATFAATPCFEASGLADATRARTTSPRLSGAFASGPRSFPRRAPGATPAPSVGVGRFLVSSDDASAARDGCFRAFAIALSLADLEPLYFFFEKPAASRSASFLSVFSQLNSGRPK